MRIFLDLRRRLLILSAGFRSGGGLRQSIKQFGVIECLNLLICDVQSMRSLGTLATSISTCVRVRRHSSSWWEIGHSFNNRVQQMRLFFLVALAVLATLDWWVSLYSTQEKITRVGLSAKRTYNSIYMYLKRSLQKYSKRVERGRKAE